MGEDSYTEYKSSFSDAVIETLTAFANTKGGKVLVGVDDTGKPIQGFTLGQETLQKWVNEVKNKTQPSIIADADVIRIKGVSIGELSVKEFPVKPVAFRGRYFRRIKNSNQYYCQNSSKAARISAIICRIKKMFYQTTGRIFLMSDYSAMASTITRFFAGGIFHFYFESGMFDILM